MLKFTLTAPHQGQIQNEIAAYADNQSDVLEVYFSNLGPNYIQEVSWFQPFRRSALRSIEIQEHGWALISMIESGTGEQDNWNSNMIAIAAAYKKKKGVFQL